MTEWHADTNTIARYLDDDVTAAEAASVEAHVAACGACQSAIAGAAGPGQQADLRVAWELVRSTLHAPRPLPVERLLVAVRIPAHLSRVVAATRGLTWAWLAATGLLVALAAEASAASSADTARYLFSVAAPLIPLGAVAAVYAPISDPMGELVRASPIGTHGILLLRTIVVLTGALVVLGVGSLALPVSVASGRWLLPALVLSALSVVLSAWIPSTWAALGLAGTWIAGASGSIVATRGAGRAGLDVLDRFVAFRSSGQMALLAVLACSLVVLASARDRFDVEGTRP